MQLGMSSWFENNLFNNNTASFDGGAIWQGYVLADTGRYRTVAVNHYRTTTGRVISFESAVANRWSNRTIKSPYGYSSTAVGGGILFESAIIDNGLTIPYTWHHRRIDWW